jgi:hypothetical protein
MQRGSPTHKTSPPQCVTVVVGPEGHSQTYIVPETILRESSNFFNECLSRPCREYTERIVRLRAFDGDTFRIYIQFHHQGRLYISRDDDTLDALPANTPPAINNELVRCLRMYRLAHYLEDKDFKDATVDAILEIMTDFYLAHPDFHMFMTEESVRYLYRYSEPDAEIRRLIVDWAVVALDHGTFDCDVENTVEDEFGADLSKRLKWIGLGQAGQAELPNPFGGGGGCAYHVHVRSGRPCYREKFRY